MNVMYVYCYYFVKKGLTTDCLLYQEKVSLKLEGLWSSTSLPDPALCPRQQDIHSGSAAAVFTDRSFPILSSRAVARGPERLLHPSYYITA